MVNDKGNTKKKNFSLIKAKKEDSTDLLFSAMVLPNKIGLVHVFFPSRAQPSIAIII